MSTHDKNQSDPADTGRDDLRTSDTLEDQGGATEANPPRTTTGKMTAPKFGSAGSGGAELEPGPERP